VHHTASTVCQASVVCTRVTTIYANKSHPLSRASCRVNVPWLDWIMHQTNSKEWFQLSLTKLTEKEKAREKPMADNNLRNHTWTEQTHWRLNVKGPDVYIPPLIGKPEQQRTTGNRVLSSTSSRRRGAVSGSRLPEETHFGPAIAPWQTHPPMSQPAALWHFFRQRLTILVGVLPLTRYMH